MDEVNTCCFLCRYVFERQSSLSKRETGRQDGLGGGSLTFSQLLCVHTTVMIINNPKDQLYPIYADFMFVCIAVLLLSEHQVLWSKNTLSL